MPKPTKPDQQPAAEVRHEKIGSSVRSGLMPNLADDLNERDVYTARMMVDGKDMTLRYTRHTMGKMAGTNTAELIVASTTDPKAPSVTYYALDGYTVPLTDEWVKSGPYGTHTITAPKKYELATPHKHAVGLPQDYIKQYDSLNGIGGAIKMLLDPGVLDKLRDAGLDYNVAYQARRFVILTQNAVFSGNKVTQDEFRKIRDEFQTIDAEPLSVYEPTPRVIPAVPPMLGGNGWKR